MTDSTLTANLARAQEDHALLTPVLYEIYTEDKGDLWSLTRRYFPLGATLWHGFGIWEGGNELACVIRIVGTKADLQSVAHLAGDIRVVNAQTSVLVTWQKIDRLDIRELL